MSTTTSTSIPETAAALVFLAPGQRLHHESRAPTPPVTAGAAIVRILRTSVVAYLRSVFAGDGTRSYPLPTPMVPGNHAVGRVVAVGPDATTLTAGQLVFVDVTLRSRDDPTRAAVFGIHEGFDDETRRLMRGEWRDSTYAQYAKVPLENLFPLDETTLLLQGQGQGQGQGRRRPSPSSLGYSLDDLGYIPRLAIPYGGLRTLDLQPGETVIISPATGSFGSAAVFLAAAIGARVIAFGRNERKLAQFARGPYSQRIFPVPITGDPGVDGAALARYGRVHAYLDISPPMAAGSTHFRSAITALGMNGRVCLMGGLAEDTALPYHAVMHRNLKICGRWMYEREDLRRLLEMVETGVVPLGAGIGAHLVGSFALEEWEAAFIAAAENTDPGQYVLLSP
ncbi:hypothetical protein P175DRAFT_0500343 [Aspergillus ochraceoroseus IBT 24754]|uniref:Uncharacterized protein n=1 Tax=Aspergillus ochraceoroseus IBT 24754 TaxID=1392256 RepID=A0A2T5LYU5_9EURO|nr:uncharacterized protein P175DRAFT_0500343 [Aspergillus ochraceoroseus IBT 24754]PTU21446.1 hypothetical protein P175DRAFT_0500343 [Aspergillus ochraceoroseus IBT 24754]